MLPPCMHSMHLHRMRRKLLNVKIHYIALCGRNRFLSMYIHNSSTADCSMYIHNFNEIMPCLLKSRAFVTENRLLTLTAV